MCTVSTVLRTPYLYRTRAFASAQLRWKRHVQPSRGKSYFGRVVANYGCTPVVHCRVTVVYRVYARRRQAVYGPAVCFHNHRSGYEHVDREIVWWSAQGAIIVKSHVQFAQSSSSKLISPPLIMLALSVGQSCRGALTHGQWLWETAQRPGVPR